MVQVRVHTLAVDSRAQPIVVLKPVHEPAGRGKLLPIWVGVPEATAILIAFDPEAAPARPLVYDLVVRLLEACQGMVDRVEVTRLEEGTFYATITLRTSEGVRLIDARPSDSIALAIRVGAPMYVADDVLAQAGIPDVESDADEESQIAELSEFLDSVDPEDFRD